MKTIKIDLPQTLDMIELHVFADEHIGDPHCDIPRLMKRIEYVKNTPNAYCILNGDILDNSTKTSLGDVYTNALNPMEQLNRAVELFEGIKDKVWAIVPGNHEQRTWRKEGIDITRLIATQLGLQDRFSATSTLIFARFGSPIKNHGYKDRKMCYAIYNLHGTGSGRKEGSKAIRLAEMASIVDADLYIHSHSHLPMIMKQGFFRTDRNNFTVSIVDKLFVNTASNMDYGGYGEAGEFKPSSKDTPVIYLDGKRKNAFAKL